MKKFNPGTYNAKAEGFLNEIEVNLTVNEHDLTDIEYFSNDSDDVGQVAIKILKDKILEHQTIEVDSISGATESQEGFKRAVNQAINQAKVKPDTASFKPGSYTGQAEGFKGTLIVKVVVDQESILAVDVDSIETPELGGRGQKKIIKEILDHQTFDFDAVSGATFTSKAMRQALYQALSKAAVDSNLEFDASESADELAYPEPRVQFQTGSLSLKEISSIFNCLPLEMTFIDRDNTIQYFNVRDDQSRSITPRSKATIGFSFIKTLPVEVRNQFEEMFKAFKAGKSEAVTVSKTNDKVKYIPLYEAEEQYIGALEIVMNNTLK